MWYCDTIRNPGYGWKAKEILLSFVLFLVLPSPMKTASKMSVMALGEDEAIDESSLKYCNEKEFRDEFVKQDKIISSKLVEYLKKNCMSKTEQNISICKLGEAYGTLSFDVNRPPPLIKRRGYYISALKAKPVTTEYTCWVYLIKVYSKLKKKIVFHRYFDEDTPEYNQGAVRFYRNFTPEDYGDSYNISLVAFPDGGYSPPNIPKHLPSNKCQYIVRYEVIKWFWDKYEGSECKMHYWISNAHRMTVGFCNYYNDTEDVQFIVKEVPNRMSISECIMTFKRPPTVIFEQSESVNEEGMSTGLIMQYSWLGLSIVLVLIISVLTYRCFIYQQKRKLNKMSGEAFEKILPPSSYDLPVVSLPADGKITVMLLHRSGCEHLDNLVRDLSFILHSYGLDVTSPLLEMSQIDAEGGIATYIQRNILSATYVVILFTETKTDQIHRTFEFSLKILSGLAYTESKNHCCRCIPIYVQPYKDILQHIPPFLAAFRSCGYQIPEMIPEMVTHMKQTCTSVLEDNELKTRLDFFMEKLKIHVRNVLQENHPHCCERKCLHGMTPDDKTELWSDTNTTLHKSYFYSRDGNGDETINIANVDKLNFDDCNSLYNLKEEHFDKWRMDSMINSEYMKYQKGMGASMPFLYPKTQIS